MDPDTQATLRAAVAAVTHLIEVCRPRGPLYQLEPRAVAQVNRTSKWLLNAIAALHRKLDAPADSHQSS
jgi:hypothetical protein